jgi:SpoVK/Ycf46/Vps4 family AAA+-type ATPase
MQTTSGSPSASAMSTSGKSDSGVTSRVISTFLTWMQEKTAPVFVACTANNHDQIPTEFMRAGRFDEVFFVDLPTKTERADIVRKLIRRKGRDPKDYDSKEIAIRSEGYTGAELEKAIDIAMLRGFREGKRPFTTDDITTALTTFQPLSKTRPEVIEAMRIWAKSRCLLANTPENTPGSTSLNVTRSLITEETE